MPPTAGRKIVTYKMKQEILAIATAVQALGAVEHIPGGCTGLAQPVDVGIGKPFKNRVRRHWEDWMLEACVAHASTKAPSIERVSQWCIDSLDDLSTEIVKNSWRHGDYSYFPIVYIIKKKLNLTLIY